MKRLMMLAMIFIATRTTQSIAQARFGLLAEKHFSRFSEDTKEFMSAANNTSLTLTSLNSKNRFGVGLTGQYAFSAVFAQIDAIYRQNTLSYRLVDVRPDRIPDTSFISHNSQILAFPLKAGIYSHRFSVSAGVVSKVMLDRHGRKFENETFAYKKRNIDMSMILQAEVLLYPQVGVRCAYEKSFSRLGDYVYTQASSSRLASRENYVTIALVVYIASDGPMKARKCVRRPEFLQYAF